MFADSDGTMSDHPGELVTMPKRQDYAETAALLRRLLAAVDAGELTAGTPKALALLRRTEGAAAAFEQAAGQSLPIEP